MKGKNKTQWIEKGYEMVSTNGFSNVKVESIAREMNKNKSSFYHYFGDWEGFEVELLDHHLRLAGAFALGVNDCQNIIPDVVNLFLEHKTDIFFHKQLRINRKEPHYKKCFESVYVLFENAFLEQWIIFLNLEDHSFLASKILTLISENFLLQITIENYNYDWLKSYLLDVSKLMLDMNSQAKK